MSFVRIILFEKKMLLESPLILVASPYIGANATTAIAATETGIAATIDVAIGEMIGATGTGNIASRIETTKAAGAIGTGIAIKKVRAARKTSTGVIDMTTMMKGMRVFFL